MTTEMEKAQDEIRQMVKKDTHALKEEIKERLAQGEISVQ